MARTSLGPWKFIRDMGSSSHWGLIMAPGQEVYGDYLGEYPSGHTTLKWRRINVDATWSRRIDVDTTSFW